MANAQRRTRSGFLPAMYAELPSWTLMKPLHDCHIDHQNTPIENVLVAARSVSANFRRTNAVHATSASASHANRNSCLIFDVTVARHIEFGAVLVDADARGAAMPYNATTLNSSQEIKTANNQAMQRSGVSGVWQWLNRSSPPADGQRYPTWSSLEDGQSIFAKAVMNTSHKCPYCGHVVKIESSQSRRRSRINEYLVMVAIFLAAGWALLNSGHMFWGAVSIIGAVTLPILNDFCTRFQQLYPIRAQAKLERETELLHLLFRTSDFQFLRISVAVQALTQRRSFVVV